MVKKVNAASGKNKRVFHLLIIMLVCVILRALPAHSKREEPVQPVVKAQPEKRERGAEAIKTNDNKTPDELVVTSEYSYDPVGKPDPFEPLISEIVTPKRGGTKKSVPLTPLQKYDLRELKLTAIIHGKEPVAMVEDSAGFGYILKHGMLIGKNEGVVKGIKEDSVLIEEKVYDPSGNLITKIATLMLHKSETEE